MMPSQDQALKKLLKYTFKCVAFRGEQKSVIKNILAGKNPFVLMPPGLGKSLCYQLPALLLPHTTIVISPLIALMKNQVDQLKKLGVSTAFLNSSLSTKAISATKKEVLEQRIKILYVAPKFLTNTTNINFLQQFPISFIAIDEAYYISSWGHNFMPEYRNIRWVMDVHLVKCPLLCA